MGLSEIIAILDKHVLLCGVLGQHPMKIVRYFQIFAEVKPLIFTKRVSFELFDCTYTELIKTNKTRFHPYKYENLKVIRKRHRRGGGQGAWRET